MTQPPRALYRSYLKHLRYIPDPHVWKTHQPYFRSLVARPAGDVTIKQVGEMEVDGGETSRAGALRESRRLRGLQRANKELHKLQAAVACHPHALARLLEEAYGQRGWVRWALINNIIRSDPSSYLTSSTIQSDQLPPLPTPLLPLAPPPIKGNDAPPVRLRPVPDTAIRKAAKRAWEREWNGVGVPLVISQSQGEGWATGWEDLQIVESLRILAGLENQISPDSASAILSRSRNPQGGERETPASINPSPPILPRQLPSYPHLPAHIRLLIPRSPLRPIPQDEAYPSPRPAHTRQNPKTWGPPRTLRPRLLRRVYARLWEKLPWVRQVVEDQPGDVSRVVGAGSVVMRQGSGKAAKAGKAGKAGKKKRKGKTVEIGGWEKVDYEEAFPPVSTEHNL